MKMTHRYILRVATNATIWVLFIFCFGLILWTTDEVLGWNILPDWIDNYAKVIVISAGILTGVMLVLIFVSGFALIAEAFAKNAKLEDFHTSGKFWRKIVFFCLSIILLFFIFHRVDIYRKNIIKEKKVEIHKQKFEKINNDLNEEIKTIVNLFTKEDLIFLASPDTSKGNYSDNYKKDSKHLADLLKSIHISTVHNPSVFIVIPAYHPYKYCKLTAKDHISSSKNNKYFFYLNRELFTNLPTKKEREIIGTLFKGENFLLEEKLTGKFINNSNPISWGLLKHEEEIVAIVILYKQYNNYKGFSKGTQTIISN